MLQFGLPEIFFAFFPFIIVLGLIIYIISLLNRLVRAVEKIADKQ